MNSSKLIIILMTLVAILATFMYYLFSNSKTKDISFHDKNSTQIEQKVAQANVAEEIRAQTEPQASKKQTPKQTQNTQTQQNAHVSDTHSQNLTAQGSLRAEYNAFMQRAKRDTSLGEPRYSVYVLDSQKLNTKEKATINEITTTLSRRGGYLRYTLFVEKLSDDNMRIYLFNENLLDEQNWLSKGLNLPHLWFKFNQSSIQSVKNSFHIDKLKRNIGKSKLKSIELSGHTDEIGNNFYNYMLGLKRSAAIASEFLRQSGKITLQSFGKDKPISQGLSENERYKNRRVEVKFE